MYDPFRFCCGQNCGQKADENSINRILEQPPIFHVFHNFDMTDTVSVLKYEDKCYNNCFCESCNDKDITKIERILFCYGMMNE